MPARDLNGSSYSIQEKVQFYKDYFKKSLVYSLSIGS